MSEEPDADLIVDPFASTLVLTVTRDMETGDIELDYDAESWHADSVFTTLHLAAQLQRDFIWGDHPARGEEGDDDE